MTSIWSRATRKSLWVTHHKATGSLSQDQRLQGTRSASRRAPGLLEGWALCPDLLPVLHTRGRQGHAQPRMTGVQAEGRGVEGPVRGVLSGAGQTGHVSAPSSGRSSCRQTSPCVRRALVLRPSSRS